MRHGLPLQGATGPGGVRLSDARPFRDPSVEIPDRIDATRPALRRGDQSAARAPVEAEGAEASWIIATLAAEGCPRQGPRLVKVVGLPILGRLRLAQSAGFSVRHHGSHKMGWRAATPGVVHSNTGTLGQLPKERVFQQAEDSIRPISRPAGFSADEASDATEDAKALHRLFDSDRILDPAGFVGFVLDRRRKALPADPPGAAEVAPARRPARGFLHTLRRAGPG